MDNKILVSIAMPNENDLEVMNESVKTLESFGVPCEVMVVSAHRSPEQMMNTLRMQKIEVLKLL